MLFFFSFSIFGCYTEPINPLDQDLDKDGYSQFEGDCDDADPTLNPEDKDGDGFSTCTGDCSDLDPYVYTGVAYLEQELGCMRDADGDGYGDDTPPALVTAGTDCNDRDPNIGPFDNDNDGVTVCEDDCDDTNPVYYHSLMIWTVMGFLL